ncbi:MAG: tRNA lysidine(34) synthetase TilS, partial [Calditrichota bacterium]
MVFTHQHAEIKEQFKYNCLSHHLIEPGDCILAATSGGPDSTALLHLLAELRTNIGFELRAAIFHHGLRPEAEAEVQGLSRRCSELEIPCVVGRGNAQAAADREKCSLHDTARRLRYDFLAQTALNWGRNRHGKLPVIATGHQADDQVETMLMRLFTGCGAEGLAGMDWKTTWKYDAQEIIIVHPLLSIRREAIESYCHEEGLTYFEDLSNLDPRYPRSRIREKILPQILD